MLKNDLVVFKSGTPTLLNIFLKFMWGQALSIFFLGVHATLVINPILGAMH